MTTDPAESMYVPSCVTVAGDNATVVLPFENVTRNRRQAWNAVATELLRSGTAAPFGPPVTTGGQITRFQLQDTWAGTETSGVRALTGEGVAFEDLLRLAAVGSNTTLGMSPVQAGDAVEGALRTLAHGWPDLVLRDAIGWTLLGWHVTGGFEPDLLFRFVRPWLDNPQMPRGGWLYLGAGFSESEVADAVADGGLDDDLAITMAALRGTVLPVG